MDKIARRFCFSVRVITQPDERVRRLQNDVGAVLHKQEIQGVWHTSLTRAVSLAYKLD